MIATKELMIGNYVKVNGKPYKVDEVFANAVGLEKWDTLFHESELEPIPITKELLVKNGFIEELYFDNGYQYIKKIGEFRFKFKYGISVTKNRDWFLFIANADSNCVASVDVQYVHQAQNLMNILGGKLQFNF